MFSQSARRDSRRVAAIRTEAANGAQEAVRRMVAPTPPTSGSVHILLSSILMTSSCLSSSFRLSTTTIVRPRPIPPIASSTGKKTAKTKMAAREPCTDHRSVAVSGAHVIDHQPEADGDQPDHRRLGHMQQKPPFGSEIAQRLVLWVIVLSVRQELVHPGTRREVGGMEQ